MSDHGTADGAADGTADDGTSEARKMLDAWRECGADRLDPLRFHFIEALDRRAGGHGGAARRILDDRISGLLAAYADDLERATRQPGNAALAASPCEPAPASLASLASLAPLIAHGAGHVPVDGAADGGPAVPRGRAYPELEMLDDFRGIWSRLSADRQVRHSEQQVPDNAGPLNSNSLVHRALALMQELSPAYLREFLSYVDALSWMEQMTDSGALADKEAARARGARKGARGRSR